MPNWGEDNLQRQGNTNTIMQCAGGPPFGLKLQQRGADGETGESILQEETEGAWLVQPLGSDPAL